MKFTWFSHQAILSVEMETTTTPSVAPFSSHCKDVVLAAVWLICHKPCCFWQHCDSLENAFISQHRCLKGRFLYIYWMYQIMWFWIFPLVSSHENNIQINQRFIAVFGFCLLSLSVGLHIETLHETIPWTALMVTYCNCLDWNMITLCCEASVSCYWYTTWAILAQAVMWAVIWKIKFHHLYNIS